MACELSEEQLWSWIDREAPELREHVATCDDCRRREAELRRAIVWVAAGREARGHLPDRVGGYRVLRLIGEGAQGCVYEAEQQTTRRRVALKVFRGSAARPGHDARQFEREVQSLARLRHPGIAAIYEAGFSDEGGAYIAMELVDGLPLTVFAAQRGLSARERLRLVVRVCHAVVVAHQRGVIHRDLKPSNILVDESGQPHVLDFGLARLADSDLTLTCTLAADGRVVGPCPT